MDDYTWNHDEGSRDEFSAELEARLSPLTPIPGTIAQRDQYLEISRERQQRFRRRRSWFGLLLVIIAVVLVSILVLSYS